MSINWTVLNYDVINSEVFADICDSQMLELTTNWRAHNDPEFAECKKNLSYTHVT